MKGEGDKMERAEQLTQLAGTVEGVAFRNRENGWSVVDISCEGELITAVGEFSELCEGEEVELTGVFVNHPTFGRQFKASLCTTKLPATAGAILKYLASGAIKGIGPVTARRIVDRFGSRTLEVIEKDPDALAQIQGISLKKAEDIHLEYQRVFGIRSLLAFMAQYGFSAAEAIKVWKFWGPQAQELLCENPYRLCLSFIGISFDRADAMAIQLGLSPDSGERVQAAAAHVLRHNTQNGHTCLPREKLAAVTASYIGLPPERVDFEIGEMLERESLVEYTGDERPMIFLPDYYRAEGYIATRLQMLISFMPDNGTQWDRQIAAQEKALGIVYAGTQREAIAQALRQGFVVLTGGPGTGKTTTINGMIELFEADGRKVALCAPTGRAAKRMSAVTGREAKTIHRLLEAGYQKDGTLAFTKNEEDLLDCDVLILDEVSMVDVLLFEALLRAIKLNCKLVLVGDYDQLPSVGAGNLLKDIIDSGFFPVVRLSHIFRQAAQSAIVTSAHEILEGQVPDLAQRDKDFFFLPARDKPSGLALIRDLVTARLPKAYGLSPADIQVLSPGRRGAAGVQQQNRILREAVNPARGQPEIGYMGLSFRQGDKVMQTRNNYDIVTTQEETGEKGTGVFNGDMGQIEEIDRKNGLIHIRYEDKSAAYTPDMLGEIEHAYAVTVHKSQGSEFDAVILSLLEPNPKLYFRNLLYTAVTRAKKLLVIVGSRRAVEMMVENNRKTLRYSGLGSFLRDILG